MGTAFPEVFARLAEPFHPDDVRVRSHDKAKYITARSVMNRLDDVLGPEHWNVEFEPFGPHAVKCTITVRLVDAAGEPKAILRKQGVGAKSTMTSKGGKTDPGDDDKGGESDALKRAAVYLGIGRYLYNDGQVDFRGPDTRDDGAAQVATVSTYEDRDVGRVAKFIAWCESNGHLQRAAALARSNYGKEALTLVSPEQAEAIYKLLAGTKALATVPPPRPREHGEAAPARVRGAVNENGSPVAFGWPRSGAALFAWCKNLEQAYQVVLVKAIDAEFCKPGGWPSTYKEWNADQVETAALFAARIVAKQEGYDGQFDDRIPKTEDLKARIRDRAAALLKHHGSTDATDHQVNACIHSVAQDLAAGWPDGELLGDFDASDDLPRLKQVLDQIEKDLAESEEFTF